MLKSKSVFSDNEYSILSEVMENEKVTQRELSKKLGVSVSTVNILMNKLIKEGLIKMTQVSQKQVLYMLTPIGIMEKAKKTVSYLKIHYRAIYEMKERLKEILSELVQKYSTIFVWINDTSMKEVINISINEFTVSDKYFKIILIENECQFNIKRAENAVLLYMEVNEDDLRKFIDIFQMKKINLIERL